MQRLNADTLKQVSARVEMPQYDRTKVRAGIVHLGIGAFHRAHQAWYTEQLLNQGAADWQIIGASLRSASVQQQLAPQDGLYTLVERGAEGERFQVVGAVKEVLVGPEDPQALLAAMAAADTKIVSLTITEKGYCHDPATGNLNLEHPDIQHDLAQLHNPKSAIGYLVAALRQRREAGVPSFTAMSCDNLPDNGRVLEQVVIQFAEQVDTELARWIQAHTRFPCTMVDRIVPATTEADRAELESQLGLRDEGVVLAEPFSQWVIEDNFAGPRPAWETVGALLVKDVYDYEVMKLRLLNGSHSLLAYTGYLAGFATVSELMTEPAFVRLCKVFMDREVGETLKVPTGFDMEDYKRQLRERFANPGLKHRTWQIAMDGSQKIPQRWLQTLREQLAGEGHIELLCLALAAWIRYLTGVGEQGQAIDVQDPLVERLQSLLKMYERNAPAQVQAVLGIQEIFGADLSNEPRLQSCISDWLERFYHQGVLATIRAAT